MEEMKTIYVKTVVDEMESEDEKAAMVAKLEALLCKLVSNDDKIITDTLAEKLQTGLQ